MPYYGSNKPRKRSKAGRELDAAYKRHEIGCAYYRKIWNKRIYWECTFIKTCGRGDVKTQL